MGPVCEVYKENLEKIDHFMISIMAHSLLYGSLKKSHRKGGPKYKPRHFLYEPTGQFVKSLMAHR